MRRATGEAGEAAQAGVLRTALPGWAVLYNPFAFVWMAFRSPGPLIGSSTPAGLLRKVTGHGGEDAVMDPHAVQALVHACKELGLYALWQGYGVRAWLPSHAGSWPIPDGALWVLPGYDPGDGGQAWLWEQGDRRGRHPRDDIEGTAAAVAAFLRAASQDVP